MGDLFRRTVVLKYAGEIDALAREIRRWISDSGIPPGEELILKQTEDAFFSSELSRQAEIREMSVIVSAVFDRVSGRYGLLIRTAKKTSGGSVDQRDYG